VTQNLTLQHNKIVYQLDQPHGTRAFRGAQVMVVEDAQGQITLEYQGRQLAYTLYQRQSRQAEVVPSKRIAAAVEAAQRKPAVTLPAANHPWRNYPKPKAPAELTGPGTPEGTFLFWVDILQRPIDKAACQLIIAGL